MRRRRKHRRGMLAALTIESLTLVAIVAAAQPQRTDAWLHRLESWLPSAGAAQRVAGPSELGAIVADCTDDWQSQPRY